MSHNYEVKSPKVEKHLPKNRQPLRSAPSLQRLPIYSLCFCTFSPYSPDVQISSNLLSYPNFPQTLSVPVFVSFSEARTSNWWFSSFYEFISFFPRTKIPPNNNSDSWSLLRYGGKKIKKSVAVWEKTSLMLKLFHFFPFFVLVPKKTCL